jgi:hypothetical protein
MVYPSNERQTAWQQKRSLLRNCPARSKSPQPDVADFGNHVLTEFRRNSSVPTHAEDRDASLRRRSCRPN